MNALEKILEEIEERVNMVENIPVDEDDDFLDGEECYEAGRVQGRYEELLWCRNMIRSHMDDDLCTNTKNNMDEMTSIDSAIKILRNMQNPRIDYADMVGAPAFCYGKRYVFPEQEDYAIETALIALNEKKDRNIHGNNAVESNIDNKCSDCSRRKWYQKGYEDGMRDVGNIGWNDCKKAMPGKDMDKQPVWIVYGSPMNLSVEFAYCKWVLSEDEDGNDDSRTEFRIDQAPQPYHPSLNLVHYWKPVNIPKFEKE